MNHHKPIATTHSLDYAVVLLPKMSVLIVVSIVSTCFWLQHCVFFSRVFYFFSTIEVANFWCANVRVLLTKWRHNAYICLISKEIALLSTVCVCVLMYARWFYSFLNKVVGLTNEKSHFMRKREKHTHTSTNTPERLICFLGFLAFFWTSPQRNNLYLSSQFQKDFNCYFHFSNRKLRQLSMPL